MNLIVGQGAITTTPLQVANAYANLVRGYTLVPRINIEKFTDNLEMRILQIDSNFKKTFLKDLGSVTNPGGTAYKSFLVMGENAYDTGGKTGTAQTIEGKNSTSWFVGLDSITNPQYIVAVVVEEGGSGSAVAAPVARRIIQYLKGLEVTPVEFGEVTE
jgi:penicillin-binding protein 2